MERQERIEYLRELFEAGNWFRAMREVDGKWKPYLDLTREDCELIAELLRNEKQYANDLRELDKARAGQ